MSGADWLLVAWLVAAGIWLLPLALVALPRLERYWGYDQSDPLRVRCAYKLTWLRWQWGWVR